MLELFRSHPLLGAGECARMLGMPRASTHRMLASLRAAGALESTPRGQYRLTLRMFELGLHVPRQRWLSEASYLPMEGLVGTTRLSAHLAVRDGLELVYMVKLRHVPDRTRAQAGDRNALHATALGKVLLAYAPAEVVDAVVRAGLARYTPYTVRTAEQLRGQLQRVRDCGFAHDREERTLGLVSVAAPVRDHRGQVVAALSLLAPAEKHGPGMERLAQALAGTRGQIEQNLGAPATPGAAGPARAVASPRDPPATRITTQEES